MNEKYVVVGLLLILLVGLAVAKCIWPTLDDSQINMIVTQILTGLGVYHFTGKS